MNKIVKHATPRGFFADHFFSVEAVTPEGNPYTFATIYFNKHGRTNLTGPGRAGRFIAGSNSRTAIKKYAATVNPDTDRKVFIIAGEVLDV